MRIAITCLDYPPRRTTYGSGTVADDLTTELTRTGHDLRIITPGRFERRHWPNTDPRLIEIPAELSTRYLLPPDKPKEMFASPEDLLAWNQAALTWHHQAAPLNSWHPQIIYNDGWSTQPLAAALAKQYDCPVVSNAHVIDRHYAAVRKQPQRPSETLFAAAEEACFADSDKVIVPSQAAYDLAAHYYPSYRSKLAIVAHGVDWSKVDKGRTPAAADSTSTTITVYYLGRISSERGWEPFLTAFAAAVAHDNRLNLRVIGDGKLAEARQRFDHPAIRFLGALPRTEALAELTKGDLFCNPALMETFGMAELEALGLGLCVISNTGPGKNTHVRHLSTGVQIPIISGQRPQLDQHAWVTWLLKLADDAELRHRLQEAGRRTARQEYNIATMATNLLTHFKQAIDDHIGSRVAPPRS